MSKWYPYSYKLIALLHPVCDKNVFMNNIHTFLSCRKTESRDKSLTKKRKSWLSKVRRYQNWLNNIKKTLGHSWQDKITKKPEKWLDTPFYFLILSTERRQLKNWILTNSQICKYDESLSWWTTVKVLIEIIIVPLHSSQQSCICKERQLQSYQTTHPCNKGMKILYHGLHVLKFEAYENIPILQLSDSSTFDKSNIWKFNTKLYVLIWRWK